MPQNPSGSFRLGGLSALLLLLIGSFPATLPGQPAAPLAILPPLLSWNGASEALAVGADHPWVTPSEAGGLRTTPSYTETIAWLERLAAASPRVRMLPFGRSPEGRDLWLVVVSKEGAKSPADLAANGRPTVLAQAGIHAGEIDGKDAGMMLLRDLALPGGSLAPLLDRVNLLFVPILNVDGHERASDFGRINQRGPEKMGWRTTARNLNLNRDYAKLDAPETRALVRLLNDWRPDLYLDLHVTDGADYQYDITYGWNGRHAGSPAIATWLDETLRPAADRDLSTAGHIPGPLVQHVDGGDPSQGIFEWTASPRFSTGYGDARHLATILVENHSLKPYRQRVLGTRVLLESVLRLLTSPPAAEGLRRATAADRARRPSDLPLGWKPAAEPGKIVFRGITWRTSTSAISGGPRIEWLGKPETVELPVVRLTAPAATARRPTAYWIPAAWPEVIERLALHGIAFERIERPKTVAVEMDRIIKAQLPKDASEIFEGRVPLEAELAHEQRTETYPSGSVRVPTDQPLGDLAILLLDPGSADSFFRWGFFLEVLQRTEYAESYVMEPMAERMLALDPALRAEFARRLETDAAFAASPAERLDFFYRRTPFYDERAGLVPVAREVAVSKNGALSGSSD